MRHPIQTLPRRVRRSKITAAVPLTCSSRDRRRSHQFDRATFDIGREEIPIPGTEQTIGIYSPERSIADAFRLRGEVGYELARESFLDRLTRTAHAEDFVLR